MDKELLMHDLEKTRAATEAANKEGKGFKADQNKLRWDLLPESLEDVVSVLTYGAKKYAPNNWRKVPDAESRYVAAAFRHLWARARGERNDPDTGLPHVAHAVCCLLFLGALDKKS
jgi:hypothetical protein